MQHTLSKRDGLNVNTERGRATLVGTILAAYNVENDREIPGELLRACAEYQEQGDQASYFSIRRLRESLTESP